MVARAVAKGSSTVEQEDQVERLDDPMSNYVNYSQRQDPTSPRNDSLEEHADHLDSLAVLPTRDEGLNYNDTSDEGHLGRPERSQALQNDETPARPKLGRCAEHFVETPMNAGGQGYDPGKTNPKRKRPIALARAWIARAAS